MIFLQSYLSRTEAVYPTGTVDLMTMMAVGFAFITSSITFSTVVVSKCWVTESELIGAAITTKSAFFRVDPS